MRVEVEVLQAALEDMWARVKVSNLAAMCWVEIVTEVAVKVESVDAEVESVDAEVESVEMEVESVEAELEWVVESASKSVVVSKAEMASKSEEGLT